MQNIDFFGGSARVDDLDDNYNYNNYKKSNNKRSSSKQRLNELPKFDWATFYIITRVQKANSEASRDAAEPQSQLSLTKAQKAQIITASVSRVQVEKLFAAHSSSAASRGRSSHSRRSSTTPPERLSSCSRKSQRHMLRYRLVSTHFLKQP